MKAGPKVAVDGSVATDERQAGLCFRAAARMVELHPALEARVRVYADQLTVSAWGASFQVLPAVPKRLEGLDYTLAVVDEAGRVDQEVYEVVSLATSKQQSSVVLAIGTPGPELEQTALGRLRTYAIDHPEVALAFDGSFNGDTTVLVVATVDQRTHVDLVECGSLTAARSQSPTWRPPSGRRAGAGGCRRSPPTCFGGRARSSSSTARGYRYSSTHSPQVG